MVRELYDMLLTSISPAGNSGRYESRMEMEMWRLRTATNLIIPIKNKQLTEGQTLIPGYTLYQIMILLLFLFKYYES